MVDPLEKHGRLLFITITIHMMTLSSVWSCLGAPWTPKCNTDYESSREEEPPATTSKASHALSAPSARVGGKNSKGVKGKNIFSWASAALWKIGVSEWGSKRSTRLIDLGVDLETSWFYCPDLPPVEENVTCCLAQLEVISKNAVSRS